MCVTRTRRMLHEDLLTAKRTVSAPAPVRIAANITVHVSDVVLVLLVELVVRHLSKGCPPEEEGLVEGKPDTLQEQGVLQTAVVLEMGVTPQGPVEVSHAGGKVLGEVVDVAGRDLGAVQSERARQV